MTKNLIRFIALLLIPCLIADPATAAAWSRADSPARPLPAVSTAFEDQALTNILTHFGRAPNVKPTYQEDQRESSTLKRIGTWLTIGDMPWVKRMAKHAGILTLVSLVIQQIPGRVLGLPKTVVSLARVRPGMFLTAPHISLTPTLHITNILHTQNFWGWGAWTLTWTLTFAGPIFMFIMLKAMPKARRGDRFDHVANAMVTLFAGFVGTQLLSLWISGGVLDIVVWTTNTNRIINAISFSDGYGLLALFVASVYGLVRGAQWILARFRPKAGVSPAAAQHPGAQPESPNTAKDKGSGKRGSEFLDQPAAPDGTARDTSAKGLMGRNLPGIFQLKTERQDEVPIREIHDFLGNTGHAETGFRDYSVPLGKLDDKNSRYRMDLKRIAGKAIQAAGLDDRRARFIPTPEDVDFREPDWLWHAMVYACAGTITIHEEFLHWLVGVCTEGATFDPEQFKRYLIAVLKYEEERLIAPSRGIAFSKLNDATRKLVMNLHHQIESEHKMAHRERLNIEWGLKDLVTVDPRFTMQEDRRNAYRRTFTYASRDRRMIIETTPTAWSIHEMNPKRTKRGDETISGLRWSLKKGMLMAWDNRVKRMMQQSGLETSGVGGLVWDDKQNVLSPIFSIKRYNAIKRIDVVKRWIRPEGDRSGIVPRSAKEWLTAVTSLGDGISKIPIDLRELIFSYANLTPFSTAEKGILVDVVNSQSLTAASVREALTKHIKVHWQGIVLPSDPFFRAVLWCMMQLPEKDLQAWLNKISGQGKIVINMPQNMDPELLKSAKKDFRATFQDAVKYLWERYQKPIKNISTSDIWERIVQRLPNFEHVGAAQSPRGHTEFKMTLVPDLSGLVLAALNTLMGVAVLAFCAGLNPPLVLHHLLSVPSARDMAYLIAGAIYISDFRYVIKRIDDWHSKGIPFRNIVRLPGRVRRAVVLLRAA